MLKRDSQFVRFVVIGLVNTANGMLLFALLEIFMRHQLAWTLGHAINIVLSFLLNSKFVFRTPVELDRFLKFPILSVVQYFYGLVGLTLLVDWLKVPSSLAIMLVVGTFIPISFLLSRKILTGGLGPPA